nr:DNA polymerase III subunit gamma/tau C-terminal domain-containing protein [Kangiella sp. HZ709]
MHESADNKSPELETKPQAVAEQLADSKTNGLANHSKLSQAESLETPEKTLKVDPLASLHAALGLGSGALETSLKSKPEHEPNQNVNTTVANASQDISDVEPLEPPKAFSKSIEDELEETSKKPLSIPDGLQETVEVDTITNGFHQFKPELSDTTSNEHEIILQTSEQASVELKQTRKENYLLAKVSDEWAKVVLKLGLVGTLEQIVHSSLFDWISDNQANIQVDPKLDLICTDSAKAGIEEALVVFYDKTLSITWSFSEAKRETPAVIFERLMQEKHAKACETLLKHPFSKEIIQHFDAQLIKPSVRYLE